MLVKVFAKHPLLAYYEYAKHYDSYSNYTLNDTLHTTGDTQFKFMLLILLLLSFFVLILYYGKMVTYCTCVVFLTKFLFYTVM